MYRLKAFGGHALPHVDPVQDQSARPAKTDIQELPGGGLFDAHGSDPDPDGATTVTKSTAITGAEYGYTDAALKTELDTLRALVGTRAHLWREAYSTGELQWCLARFSRLAAVRRPGDRWRLQVDLTFELVSPVWHGADEVFDVIDPWDEDDDDLCTCGAEGLASGDPIVMRLRNDGDKNVSEIVITLTARLASATSLTITSATTGHSFSWSGTLGTDKSLVIDTGVLTVLNDGAGDYPSFTEPTDKEAWMEIAPGTNEWTVEVEGTDFDLLVEYEDAWA